MEHVFDYKRLEMEEFIGLCCGHVKGWEQCFTQYMKRAGEKSITFKGGEWKAKPNSGFNNKEILCAQKTHHLLEKDYQKHEKLFLKIMERAFRGCAIEFDKITNDDDLLLSIISHPHLMFYDILLKLYAFEETTEIKLSRAIVVGERRYEEIQTLKRENSVLTDGVLELRATNSVLEKEKKSLASKYDGAVQSAEKARENLKEEKEKLKLLKEEMAKNKKSFLQTLDPKDPQFLEELNKFINLDQGYNEQELLDILYTLNKLESYALNERNYTLYGYYCVMKYIVIKTMEGL